MADVPDRTVQQTDPREAVQEVLRALRRDVPRVAFTTLVMLLVGGFLAMLWPNKYMSLTQFVLRDWRVVSDAVLLDELSDIPLARKLKTLENELRSRKRVEAVLDDLQWPEWAETAGKEAERRELILKIGSNLMVAMDADVTGAHNVTLAFKWTSPRKAADFVNAMRNMWIQLTIEGYERGIEQQKERMEGVVQQRQADYEAALSAVKTYQQEQRVPDLLSAEVNNQVLGELIVAQSASEAELESLSSQILEVQRKLETIPRVVEQSRPPDSPDQADLLVRLDAAEASLEKMSHLYTPQHPKRKQAQTEHDRLLSELSATGYDLEGGRIVQQDNPDWVAAFQALLDLQQKESEKRALVNANQRRIDEARQRLDLLPVVTAELARRQADVDVKAKLLDEAMLAVQPLRERVQQLRAANFGVDTNGYSAVRGGPFEILETGVEPLHPVMPITAMILAVSLLLGLGLGAAVPILGELTRGSFGTVKEVSRSLGVPVLGAVDLILTARDLRARTAQRALTYATMALVLLSMGTALYIYWKSPDVFPDALRRTLREVRMFLT